MFTKKYFIRGVTLLEMMLSLLLSMSLLMMLTTIYLATVKNNSAQIAYTTIQENGRLAMQILFRHIHAAGYIGCARLTEDFPLQNYLQYSLQSNNKITGTESEITLKSASIESAYLQQSMSNVSVLLLSSNVHFKRNDIVVISDCKSAEIFQIKSIETVSAGSQKMITQMPLHKQYDQYAEVSLFEENHYFVADTKRVDSTGKIIKALFQRNYHGHNVELVEGVEQLRFDYDVLRNGVIFRVNAKDITDWDHVVGVNIALTLQTMNAYPLHKIRYGYAAISSF